MVISLVLLMVLLSHSAGSSSWVSGPCVASLVRLGVGTGVWYLMARGMFPYVEHITGGWRPCISNTNYIKVTWKKDIYFIYILYISLYPYLRCLPRQCLFDQARLPSGRPQLDWLWYIWALLPPLLEQSLHGGGVQPILSTSCILSTPEPRNQAQKMFKDSLLFYVSADSSRGDNANIHITLFPFILGEITRNLLWPGILVLSLHNPLP